MTVYAIGDLQGCLDQFRALLDKIAFDPDKDRLWLAGDLVSRGPASLETLRFVRQLGDAAVAVLGNHDLNLLAVSEGKGRNNRKDRIEPILNAPDRDELLHWLRYRPLLHYDQDLDYAMVHAGFAPQWRLGEALACAMEVESCLRGPDYVELLENMYGSQPDLWQPQLSGWDRLRFAINCFTRLRYCHADGRLELGAKGAPGSQPPDLYPWFRVPERANADTRIVFGHWSTLGVHIGDNVFGMDSGCVWGGHLSALTLDGAHTVVRVDCPAHQAPD